MTSMPLGSIVFGPHTGYTSYPGGQSITLEDLLATINKASEELKEKLPQKWLLIAPDGRSYPVESVIDCARVFQTAYPEVPSQPVQQELNLRPCGYINFKPLTEEGLIPMCRKCGQRHTDPIP